MKDESLFYDHYKDSFEQQKKYLSKRDRLTAVILVLFTIMLGVIYDANFTFEMINKTIQHNNTNFTIDVKYINTALIFYTLWCIIQYYQIVMQIEKMYDYIKLCEHRLSEESEYRISREGDFYQKKNPILSKLANFCYVYILPVVIICISAFKVYREWITSTYFRFVDIAGLMLIIAFSFSYIITRKTMKHATEL